MTTAVQVRWIAGKDRVAHAYEPRARLSVCGYMRRPYVTAKGSERCAKCVRETRTAT